MKMITIPKSWGVHREPRTPKQYRSKILTLGIPYNDLFDWYTLFNEALDIGYGRVLLIGPPLYELKRLINFTHKGNKLNHIHVDLTNVTLTLVETEEKEFTLSHPTEDIQIKVSPLCNDFEGLGCISTMQKNEPIEWIEDWVSYYYYEHGVRGFVVYDNNSDKYTVDELQTRLDSLNLDGAIIHVVDWCVPFGPHTPQWDSNYSQYTQFEHWKYKYCWCAKYAINHDIDELLVIDGKTIDNVVDEMASKGVGAIRYKSRNIDPYNERLGKSAHELEPIERRYWDYYYYSEYNNTDNTPVEQRVFTKWITIPELSMEYQWRVHDFWGNNNAIELPMESGVYFAHFYALQSKHKDKHICFHNRNKQLVEVADLSIDKVLKSKLENVNEQL